MRRMSKRPNGTGNVYRRGSVWWIRYSRNGKQYAESSKSEDRKAAERMLATRLGDIATGRFQGLTAERITVWNLCELVVADYEFHNKRGLADLRWRAEKHLRRPFEQILAFALTPEKLKSYKKDRRLGGAADATINRELAVIRRGLTLGKQAGLYRGDAPHFGLFKLDNARQGFVEDSDYRKLLEALPSHLKCLAIAGYHLGMRAGELRKLQWSQVDLGNREIRLAASQTKGKRPRTAPVYGDLIPALLQQKAEHDANWPDLPWVFHWMGKPIGHSLKGWRRSATAAGVPDLLFHDLRRSAIRNMERAGIPRKIAMSISGHRTESVYLRYDIVGQKDLAIARERLEAFHIEQREISTRKDNQEKSKPPN
jgi:integrase